MSFYIESNKKAKSIFANVNGEKKNIVSAWVNRDGVPAKVFLSNKLSINSNNDIIGIIGTDIYYYSNDDMKFIKATSPTLTYETNNYALTPQIYCGDSAFVIGGQGEILYSTDKGLTWTKANIPSSITVEYSCTFGGYFDGKFILGYSKINRYSTTEHRCGFIVLVSNDGINWEQGNSPFTWLRCNYIYFTSLNHSLMVMGYNYKISEFVIYITPDGLNWEKIANPVGTKAYLCAPIYNKDTQELYVICNPNVYITNDECNTWRSLSMNEWPGYVYNGIYSNALKKFCFYNGTGTYFYFSSDCVNFEVVKTPITDSKDNTITASPTKNGFVYAFDYYNGGCDFGTYTAQDGFITLYKNDAHTSYNIIGSHE